MFKPIALLAGAVTLAAISAATPTRANAQEVFGGVYAHAVDTPFTLETTESGSVDIAAGVRFGGIEALDFIGSPEPYVVGNLNTSGDTSFAGVGLRGPSAKARSMCGPVSAWSCMTGRNSA